MELLFEILFEVWGELMLLVIPEKNVTKRMRWLSRLLAVLSLVTVVALALWGIWLTVDLHSLWGILPIAVAVLISLAQILLGILLYKRHH